MIRAIAHIALTCETVVINPPSDKKDISRKHLQCKVTYVAQSKNFFVLFLKVGFIVLLFKLEALLLFKKKKKKSIFSRQTSLYEQILIYQ